MRRRTKLIILAGSVVVLVAIAVAVLLGMANRILQAQLEKALGENFKVAHIGLSWGTVEADGVQMLKDGKVAASAKKLGVRADFLTIFRKTTVVSALVLEEPVIQLVIDEQGRFISPLPEEQKKQPKGTEGEPSKKASFSLHIRQITIKNGTLTIQDRRLKEPNKIEARQINARFDNFYYPLSDAVSKVRLDMDLAGKLLSGSITVEGTLNLERAGFNLAFEGTKLSAVDLPGSGPQARFERISCNASSQGMFAKSVELADVVVEKPYVRLLIKKDGELVTPLRNVLPQETGGAGRETATTKKEAGRDGKAEQTLQAVVKGLKISQGEILILDSKVAAPPHQMRFTDVSLSLDQLSIPSQDTWTAYDCALNIPGKDSTGTLRTSGKTKFKSLDTTAKASLQGLDISVMRPYVQKAGDVEVTKGTLSLDMDLRIDKRIVRAPAKAVLRNVELAPATGAADKFMALPRSAVMNYLKTTKNEIALDFVVEGSIDDPKFNLRESTTRKFAVTLAKKLGIGVVGAGETLIDAPGRGLRGIGDALKETGKGLKKLFK
jgi:uncharacterized protein involved in outer membrane biogenesis